MTVKRYEFGGHMGTSPREYVLASDYDALCRGLDTVRAVARRLRRMAKHYKMGIGPKDLLPLADRLDAIGRGEG